jgi:uncharacterized protein YndB with AHSA1/START domain
MEKKTKIHAEEGRNDLLITRDFELPVALLFRAHTEKEIFEDWMSHEYGTTKALIFDMKKYGGWKFQTTDIKGNVALTANGVVHEFIPDKKITRTFEMENSPFDVTLEFLEFEALTEETSRLTMNMVYRSVEIRNEMLKLPFEFGLNMAHNRLQEILTKLK